MRRFELAENGTLRDWVQRDGTNLLFEEQEILIDREIRKRGGAPVCCPNFGALPESIEYKDIKLPQHGLVRLGNRYTALEQGTETPALPYVYTEYYHATFLEPWKHVARITLSSRERNTHLRHSLAVTSHEQSRHGKAYIPVSLGFHPYISTFGAPFTIKHGHNVLSSKEDDFDNPVILRKKRGLPLEIRMQHGTILFSLNGGAYEHFCIWSDCVDKYICASPFFGYGSPYCLHTGNTIEGVCDMVFIPH